MPTYPSNVVFSAFSFVGFILALIPFSWHCRASSIGTCLFVTWTGLLCLVFFANSIIWNDNVIDWAPVWCDISSRFIVAMNAGFPVACLLIKRRLYNIARLSPVTNKRRELALELGLGLGLPVLEVGLYSTVEGHRFDIYEEAGCWPTMVILPWAYPLVICIPLIIGLINLLYGTLNIYRVVKERRALQELLPATHKICDHPIDSHFIRLLTLSSVEVIFTIPLACLEIYIDSRNGLYTWRGWADLRYKFSRSFFYPSVIWRADGYRLAGVELNRWSPVLCAFVFFSLFGFAEEARRNYKAAWKVLKRPIIWIAPEWMRQSLMSTSGMISRRRRLSHDMIFADGPAPTDSSLTTVCLDDGMSIKGEEACSSISLPVSDRNPTQPEPVHQELASVSRSEPAVRTVAERQSVRLLPNGMLNIVFPQENGLAWVRRSENEKTT